MKIFKVSSKEKKQMINEYLGKGLSQSEIARMLGISRQLVRYWVGEINKNGVKK